MIPSNSNNTMALAGRAIVYYCLLNEGVRNSITTVPDTFNGRGVKHNATRKTERSLGPRKTHGITKISSPLVVALLPFTVLSQSVRTVSSL
jgi:hypothetical protein